MHRIKINRVVYEILVISYTTLFLHGKTSFTMLFVMKSLYKNKKAQKSPIAILNEKNYAIATSSAA